MLDGLASIKRETPVCLSVGIIIPAFDCAQTIGPCLKACISQTHTNLEIIVIDYGFDNNTNCTIAVYQERDPRVKVIKRPSGIPCSSLFRSKLHSDYVLFVDPSEVLPSDHIEKLLLNSKKRNMFGQVADHFYFNSVESPSIYEKPSVTCVIPIYQAERYLWECLKSVNSQTLMSIEILCVDDGSSDSSLRILEEAAWIDPRVLIIENLHHGVSAARNTGILHAKGRYIAFLDSDDYLPDTATYERMYTAAEENHALICGGSFSIVDQNTKKVRYPSTGTESGMAFSESGMHSYNSYQYDFSFYRFLYNREFLVKNQLFFPERAYFEDPVWFVKTLDRAGSFYALREVTYCYRIGHKPPTSSAFSADNVRDLTDGVYDILLLADEKGYEDLRKLEEHRYFQDYAPNIAKIITTSNDVKLQQSVTRLCGLLGTSEESFKLSLLMRYAEVSDIRWRRRTADLEKRIKDLETANAGFKKSLENTIRAPGDGAARIPASRYDLYDTTEKYKLYRLSDAQDAAWEKELRKITDFETYLAMLKTAQDSFDITTILTVKDIQGFHLTGEMTELISELGFQRSEELLEHKYHPYIGVAQTNGVVYETVGTESEEYSFTNQDAEINVISACLKFGNKASVEVDGREMAVNKRGINIVVLDHNNRLIDSVAFDTHAAEMTCTRR